MTAPHVSTRELSRPDFPAVVHTYTDVLRVLSKANEQTSPPDELASATERVLSNVRRDAQKLRDAGVIAIRADGAWTLTDKGGRWVVGQNVAAGVGLREALTGTESSTAPRWPADKIRRNPINRVITVASVEGMADAIEGAEDILIPVRLTPPDANGVRMLLAGERRWEGARLCERRGSLPEALKAGIPFTEGEISADDGALIAVIENTARRDLSPWEDAQLLKAAADGLGITNASELARRIGRAREGDRGGLRDVQTKLRVATLATPAAIAAYELNGSWDELRDSCKDPDKVVTTRAQRLALAELWHKAGRTLTDVAILPAGHSAEGARLAQYGLAILTRSDKGDFARVTQAGADYLKAEKLDGGIEYARHALGFPEGYGVTKLRTEWLNTPSDDDPWLQGGWRLTTTSKLRTIVEGVNSAEARLYEHGPYYDQRFRARLTIELEDGTTVESTRVPGPNQADLAYELAVEDVVAARRDLPQAVVEWADKLSKRPFIVAGRNCLNASRAQEARYALGWDKRQSNSGGGSSHKPVETDPPVIEDDEETPQLFPVSDAPATDAAAPVPPASVMRDHLAAQAQAREHPTNAALRLIADELRRQVESEGFTPDQDDEQNEDGEMAYAAAAYAAAAAHGDPDAAMFWPGGWDPHMFKPTGETRDLVRAGALIVAELERRARMMAGRA